jgi:hypothetical protein
MAQIDPPVESPAREHPFAGSKHRRGMATVAILDEYLPSQWRERPEELEPVSVSWVGTDLAALKEHLTRERPTILALDLDLLGDEPLAEVSRLASTAQPELVLLLHRFANRSTLREATKAGVRPVKSPLRLSALRTHMTSVIVREIFHQNTAKPAAAFEPADTSPPAPGRRFSRAQLGRLAEIQSAIACECPNHLSELLISLNAFEDYSRACQNRNDADAQMHTQLADATARARSVMEDALAKLLVHERIVL